MLSCLKWLVESDNVAVSSSSENVKLLHDLALWWLFIHESLVNWLQSHELRRKSVNSQINFAKSPLTHYFSYLIPLHLCLGGLACFGESNFNLFLYFCHNSVARRKIRLISLYWISWTSIDCWVLSFHSFFLHDFQNNRRAEHQNFIWLLPDGHWSFDRLLHIAFVRISWIALLVIVWLRWRCFVPVPKFSRGGKRILVWSHQVWLDKALLLAVLGVIHHKTFDASPFVRLCWYMNFSIVVFVITCASQQLFVLLCTLFGRH